MNDAIQKLAQEVKEKMSALFESADVKKFLTATKDASEENTGTFEVVISTATLDRQGESIDPNGVDINNYLS